jgi:hypothetical protein
MHTTLLVGLRGPIAELLTDKLRDNPGVRLISEPNHSYFSSAIFTHVPDTALIEVKEHGSNDVVYCLSLCAQMRKELPSCRLILLCPEQDITCVATAMKAKRDGHIDDFLFYNATTDYMISKLLAM